MSSPQRTAVHEHGHANELGQIVLCPNSTFPLIVSKELISGLLEQVNEGIRESPQVRPEGGGLLVGPKSPAGQFLADEVVPVSSEHLFGPSLRLSPFDLDNLTLAIGSAQENSGRAVVGFYRSRTRGDAKLRDSDWEILNAIEQAHPSYAVDFRCFLILTPVSRSAVSAAAMMRSGAGWEEMQTFTLGSDPPYVTPGAPEPQLFDPPFTDMPPAAISVETPVSASFPAVEPDGRKSAAADSAMAAAVGSPSQPSPEMADASGFRESFYLPISSTWISWRRSPIWLLIGALAGMVGVYLYSTGRSPDVAGRPALSSTAPAPRPAAALAASQSPLALSAERRGADLAISWNHLAPAVVNASFGMLRIRGSGVSRDIPLNPEQLRSGSVLYTTTTDQVEIQLTVVSGEQVAHDSLIALLPQKGDVRPVIATTKTIEAPAQAAPTSLAAATSAAKPAAPPPPPPAASAGTPAITAAVPPATSATAAPTPQPAAPVALEPSSRALSSPPVSPPSRGLAASSINQVAPASGSSSPAAASGGPPAVSQPVSASTAVARPAPGAPAPATQPPAAPDAMSAPSPINPERATQSAAAQIAPPRQPTVEATPVSRVIPRFPDTLHSVLTKPKTVQVRVAIDSSGKPVNAEVLPQPESYKALDEAARVAVMQWKFRPAMMGNRPVPSSLVLEFNFSPVH